MILYLKSIFLAQGEDEPVFIVRVFEQQRTRRAMIALFLAVLEMVKLQAVEVCQLDLFGEIALRRQKSFDAVFAAGDPVSAIEKDYK
jgi:segregation and condensation protein A